MRIVPIHATAVFVGLCLATGIASAQTRAGVRPEALAPPGLRLTEVVAPDTLDGPVRLSFAPAAQQAVEVRMEVWVARDAAHALRRLDWLRETVAGDLPALSGPGDRAFGDARLLAFVRDNLVVVVRVAAGAHDALDLARRADAAVQRAPRGAPDAAPVDLLLPAAQQVGVALPVELRGDVLGAHVSASGAAYVRRTRRGWVLTRTGEAPHRVRVIAVDSLLRLTAVGP